MATPVEVQPQATATDQHKPTTQIRDGNDPQDATPDAESTEPPKDLESEKGTFHVEHIAIEKIDPNPYQPRQVFEDESLKTLAASIREQGVMQPVTLRLVDARYQLIAGERRWRASALAGLTTLPAIVRDIDDTQAAQWASSKTCNAKTSTRSRKLRRSSRSTSGLA